MGYDPDSIETLCEGCHNYPCSCDEPAAEPGPDYKKMYYELLTADQSEYNKLTTQIAALTEKLEQVHSQIRAHEMHWNAAAEVVGLKQTSSRSLASAIEKKLAETRKEFFEYRKVASENEAIAHHALDDLQKANQKLAEAERKGEA